MARLIVVEGPDRGTEFELERPSNGHRTLVVGRDERVAISLKDSAVSREHCRLEATPRGFRVIDLGSRNRTFVDGEAIDSAWLNDGQLLLVGDSELRFEDDAPAAVGYGIASTIIKELSPRRYRSGDALDRKDAENSLEGPSGDDARGLEPSAAELRRVIALAARAAACQSERDLFQSLLAELSTELACARAAYLVPASEAFRIAHEVVAGGGPKETRVELELVRRAAEDRLCVLGAPEGTARGNSVETADARDSSSPGSILAAPILADDARSPAAAPPIAGVLYLERSADQVPFGRSDLELVESVLDPIGSALARLRAADLLADENRNLLRSISATRRIVGESSGIRDVLAFIERAAPTPMTVLVVGETGTGKELVASAVHYGSPRRGRPFVALNCAALPETLVESELFGHERGAFTGAVARKKGRFELADGGTVFLDEVGELSLSCQAKLLRLLEERRFERIGGVETVVVDVRIIAATNRDLLEMVEAKQFREDLYYRLGVLQVVIPPLRDRPEDILFLAEHFLAQHAVSGRPKKLSKSAARRLTKYSWPGNVRQLRNVIESAIVLGEGREISVGDLVLPERRVAESDGWEPVSLQELERRHVLRVLEHTGGNKKRAAEMLGIERCTLYSKLKSYEA